MAQFNPYASTGYADFFNNLTNSMNQLLRTMQYISEEKRARRREELWEEEIRRREAEDRIQTILNLSRYQPELLTQPETQQLFTRYGVPPITELPQPEISLSDIKTSLFFQPEKAKELTPEQKQLIGLEEKPIMWLHPKYVQWKTGKNPGDITQEDINNLMQHVSTPIGKQEYNRFLNVKILPPKKQSPLIKRYDNLVKKRDSILKELNNLQVKMNNNIEKKISNLNTQAMEWLGESPENINKLKQEIIQKIYKIYSPRLKQLQKQLDMTERQLWGIKKKLGWEIPKRAIETTSEKLRIEKMRPEDEFITEIIIASSMGKKPKIEEHKKMYKTWDWNYIEKKLKEMGYEW